MTNGNDDRDLARAFDALRASDRANVPSFEVMRARADEAKPQVQRQGARRRALSWSAGLAAAAALFVLVPLATRVGEPARAPRATAPLVAVPPLELEFLLDQKLGASVPDFDSDPIGKP